jgi:hypothetical protein
VIEILRRELKQYFNIENFHSKSLNGVLFEVFCALIAYVLVMWFRRCHPLKGWYGACNPASPDLLEQDAGYVRLITTQSPSPATAAV